MKRILCVLLLVVIQSATAAPISFQLHGVSLVDLCRVVLDDVSGASVVLDSDLLEDQTRVSFTLKRVEPGQAVEHLRDILKTRGFALQKVGNVYTVKKRTEEDDDIFVYQPKYRSVSYLSDLLGGVIGHGAVTSQRMIQQPINQPMQQVQPMQQGRGSEAPTSAGAMIDKTDKDALVIKAKPHQLALAKRVIEQTDKPIAEMLIKAVIMEVQTGQSEGSALNLLAGLLSKGSGVQLSIAGNAKAENAVSIKFGNFEAIWSAISSDKRFKVVSSPRVLIKSGSNARFSVGADTPVLGAVNYQGNGQSVQSVEYKPSGIILDLSPQIRGELAELKIFQQLSNFARTETGVNNSPTLLKRELSTSVVVAQNDVVLLGGLDEEKHNSDNSGLFFLPEWMRSKSSDKTRSEIVLMLYVERVQTPGESI